eukprot:CAMPEP_0115852214 /NCGR_PEP_ID=MMETSP0287-20121206/12881_1 /TAXON_ID=412157 /ORGANISM="Chrysochromulina rotalis, Strain UIO044" /LENGTH=964 /DNA_ID=CAMNT_0003306269 /DNA_START=45 /DNA_END=2938 /DNA_ORIENTATION=-
MDPASVEALLAERTDHVSMAKMQSMVRVTCLEIMNSAPAQVSEYRREVLELQSLVKGYLSEVAQLKQQMAMSGSAPCGAFPPSSPSSASTCDAPGTPGGEQIVLQPSFEPSPELAWYEHKPMPRFAVQLRLPSGELYTHGDITLRISLLNGRGQPEEQKANGTGELLVGDRFAAVSPLGAAEFGNLRIAEPSSKHYGGFTMLIAASSAPEGYTVAPLQAGPMTVQVGRMWSKRRKREGELSGEDSISQIPGVGARYVARLQLHGVATIGQFAAMAATEPGKATLCKLCKGDNPRNSLNASKLQAMIDKACSVVRGEAPSKASRPAVEGAPPPALDSEPSFSMEELLLLASSDEDQPQTPEFEPLHAVSASAFGLGGGGGSGFGPDDLDDDFELRMRRLDVGGGAALGASSLAEDAGRTIAILPPKQAASISEDGASISILPPKPKSDGALTGFAALDALAAAPSVPPASPAATTVVPFAPAQRALASCLRAAWRGDTTALGMAMAASGAKVSGTDRFGCTAIHVAALAGQTDSLRALLASNPPLDVAAPQLGGATPLALAACRGEASEAAAMALLDAGASPTVRLVGGLSAAHLAAWSGATALLARLVRLEPSLASAPSDTGLSPLECAALGGHAAAIAVLLDAGARGGTAMPAVHCAALGGDASTLERLLATEVGRSQLHSTDPRSGWLPLHCAAAAASVGSVHALLAAGARADVPTEDGLLPLDLACACGHADCAEVLLEASAPATVAGAAGLDSCPALVHAVAAGDAECLRLLARRGVDVHGLLGGVEDAIARLHGAEVAAEVAAALEADTFASSSVGSSLRRELPPSGALASCLEVPGSVQGGWGCGYRLARSVALQCTRASGWRVLARPDTHAVLGRALFACCCLCDLQDVVLMHGAWLLLCPTREARAGHIYLFGLCVSDRLSRGASKGVSIVGVAETQDEGRRDAVKASWLMPHRTW